MNLPAAAGRGSLVLPAPPFASAQEPQQLQRRLSLLGSRDSRPTSLRHSFDRGSPVHAAAQCPAARIAERPASGMWEAADHSGRAAAYSAADRCQRTRCRTARMVRPMSYEGDHAAAEASTTPYWLQRTVDWINARDPPKWLWRSVAALVLGGQVLTRVLQGKLHWRNTKEQLALVGPSSLGVSLLTAAFVGMVFTIQFVREFAKLGLTKSVGGVLGLALSRELTPVVTCIIIAGRVGSAFAAELGTMQVSEQTDSLRVLGSDPVDYLVSPRVVACMIAGPILNVLCFTMGLAASTLLAQLVYDVPANVILDSAARAVSAWDVITSMIKAWVFGVIISVVSCSWGFTTTGGAKGVGESTTSAVVISLVLIFIADFALSFLFFQGQGDALRQCM